MKKIRDEIWLVFFGLLVFALFSIVLFILISNRPEKEQVVKI